MTDVADWWQTDIIDMAPGQIRLRGFAIEDLIGNIGFAEMVWLMTRGMKPDAGQAEIKSRFKAEVKLCHPDLNGGDKEAEERLRDVIWAYRHLTARDKA